MVIIVIITFFEVLLLKIEMKNKNIYRILKHLFNSIQCSIVLFIEIEFIEMKVYIDVYSI